MSRCSHVRCNVPSKVLAIVHATMTQFPLFSGIPRCRSGSPERSENGRKRAKKADFGRFSGRAGRHPLSPHLLHSHLRQPNLGYPNFRKLNLPLHSLCNSNVSIPTITSAILNFSIYNVILIGLCQEINLHLPLECNSEFVFPENIELVRHHLC